ncbi:hypothetical protein KR054_001705 [Drosophila jambulina]|nr:hypothetical protein KR054_001705 [Drosophila jambulina]
MTEVNGIDNIEQLLSCKNRSPELTVPQVTPIKDVRGFMSNSENYNGDFEDLKERLDAKTHQCQEVLKLLNKKLQLKLSTLDKVKKDMLTLADDMKKPTASTRFVINHEKIIIHYLDESEAKECEMAEALEWFNLKMGSLYCEIMGLESDVDYITYLERMSQLNMRTVIEFYEGENKAEPEKLIV